MKKIIVILLSICLLTGLCSCKRSPREKDSARETSSRSSRTTQPTKLETTAPTTIETAESMTAAPTPSPEPSPTPPPPMISPDEVNIDTQNNQQNHATFLFHEDWLYGESFARDGSPIFVRSRMDMSEWTELDKGNVSNIYIVDDYLYYLLLSFGDDDAASGIYRMKTNGEGREKLSDSYGNLQVANGFLYFTDNEIIGGITPDTNHLYRCDLDGNNQITIINKPVFFFSIFSNAIMYQDDMDGESIHICNIDGSNDQKINDSVSYRPIYDGSFIYYQKNIEEGINTIWRIAPDGTGDTPVCDTNALYNMILYDNYIYYVNADDGYRIYRIDKNGGESEMVSPDKNTGTLQIVEGWLKYRKYSEEFKYIEDNVFIRPDGSERWTYYRENR